MSDQEIQCGPGGGADDFFGLRVASIFVILVGSSFGALFPVLAKRSSWLHVPKAIFDIFSIFIVELVAFRWGTAKLQKLGVHHDHHGHNLGGHAAHGPEGIYTQSTQPVGLAEPKAADEKSTSSSDVEEGKNTHDHAHAHNSVMDNAAAQIIGVAILEFGVALHSTLIGLTLAVDPSFKVLFAVLVFHQTFEGLGIGTRLAYMRLPAKYNWVPIAGAALYGITTPVGIAVGLGVRSTYNPGSTTASIVSGVLDSLSSGILIYTGLVELLAHEFLFNKEMMDGSNKKIVYALGSMLLGCAVMALLGRWA
ncbi:hypothetical protein H0H81_006898 [Sphagnurus paluster]|uniref:Uncharacterized protein n=1 Tax=Sphagnurus paluster TaxID=117069 RepID=A0A9P7FTI7_9AGAR|nr:hypothetical protein H0H81_006898 [Sphagnurus paluster]